MNSVRPWPAPAKINRFLHVVGRRDDGYHLLQTLFQFLDAGDDLEFEIRSDTLIRRCTDLPGVAPEDDLVVRAARALQSHSGVSAGADIRVTKRIPMGGGLGGGSSNAATTLVALNALWQTGVSPDELAAIGLRLGADVPVFIHGRAAFAEGVGERLSDCAVDEGVTLVACPEVAVPTARIFNDPQLTRDTKPLKIAALSLDRCRNDCEPVTRRLYPAVGSLLDALRPEAPTFMSGTGASVFSLCRDRRHAEELARGLPRTCRWFIARRVNTSPLIGRLGE